MILGSRFTGSNIKKHVMYQYTHGNVRIAIFWNIVIEITSSYAKYTLSRIVAALHNMFMLVICIIRTTFWEDLPHTFPLLETWCDDYDRCDIYLLVYESRKIWPLCICEQWLLLQASIEELIFHRNKPTFWGPKMSIRFSFKLTML